jgi:hypothetical protein
LSDTLLAFVRLYLVIIKASVFRLAIIILSLVRIACTLTDFGLDLLIEACVCPYISHINSSFCVISEYLSLSLFNEVSFWFSISIISCCKHKTHLLFSIFFIHSLAFSTNMNRFSILFFLYSIICGANTVPTSNINGTSMYYNYVHKSMNYFACWFSC